MLMTYGEIIACAEREESNSMVDTIPTQTRALARRTMFVFLRIASCFMRRSTVARTVLVAVLLTAALPSARAKDAPITGVLIYQAAGRYNYAQVTGLLVNGKTELRACGGGGIDKSSYKNLAKINLAAVKTLERMPDGILMAEVGGASSVCVVPGNFKFEKDAALRPSDLVDKSTFSGQVLGSLPAGLTALPAFTPGTKFIFGSATDAELAEYLLADRARMIQTWQAYLGRYAASSHGALAKVGLVELLVAEGNRELASYVKSAGSVSPSYDDLKHAHEHGDQAVGLLPADPRAIALRDVVAQQMKRIADNTAAKLQSFKDAIAARDHGYSLLVSAKDLSDRLATIDPKYPPGMTMQTNVQNEFNALDRAVASANAEVQAQQYDNAYAAIAKYVSLWSEEPRLGKIVRDAYRFHMDKADSEMLSGNWDAAVADLHRAVEINPVEEAKVALTKAEAGRLTNENKIAAEGARTRSKAYLDEQDPIGAYEAFANLNDAQRMLVKDDMTALQETYVTSITRKAKELQAAHTPIRGRADEDALRQAHEYLMRADKLGNSPEISVKLDLVADQIGSYYSDLGAKYLSRPLSSGVGLGWSYLTEAQQYKPNLSAVRDLRTQNSAAYQLRSKLSIAVVFRDQTSRRVSAGFVDQLQQAFATGLETSGLPVKVILPGGSNTLEPNFQFVGEVLEHRTVRDAKKETLQSEYRSGSREIPNKEWNKADQDYQAATLALQREQSSLAAAQLKNNKKMLEEANKNLDRLQVAVQAARARMNAIPATVTDNVISPYNYTRTKLELTNTVKLSFRIKDANGNLIGDPITVTKGDQPRTFVILENVKADDTKGLKEADSPPDEGQLMTDAEVDARDSMVKSAQEQVQALPQKILSQARAKSSSNDLESAAELYVLYLNSTTAKQTPEREEAIHFLSKNFNLRHANELSASSQ
jgi:hypothetical protein